MVVSLPQSTDSVKLGNYNVHSTTALSLSSFLVFLPKASDVIKVKTPVSGIPVFSRVNQSTDWPRCQPTDQPVQPNSSSINPSTGWSIGQPLNRQSNPRFRNSCILACQPINRLTERPTDQPASATKQFIDQFIDWLIHRSATQSSIKRIEKPSRKPSLGLLKSNGG